jgi:hypothetical protein
MVRSTPASFVGSGYGVSFSKRYSVRNVTPRAAPALSNLLSYCARHHDTVMTPAGGSPGSMLKSGFFDLLSKPSLSLIPHLIAKLFCPDSLVQKFKIWLVSPTPNDAEMQN